MIYEKATVELIQFDNSDVITTSSCNNGHGQGGGHYNNDYGQGGPGAQ